MSARMQRTTRLDDASDAVLADRAADGDTRAFAALISRYRRLLRNYAYRIVGSASDSDDAVQDALISAWQQLPALEDRAAVRGWLIRITTRKALDLVRARRTHDDVDDAEVAAPTHAGPESSARTAALSTSLDSALAALPGQQRRVWTLRELGEYSYDEIATELQLPVSTVRGLLARARRTLIQQMDGWR